MSLIKCSECGREISDKAITCPQCGNPLQDINKITQQTPITVEQTTKKWKVFQLISVAFLIIGSVVAIKGIFTFNLADPQIWAGASIIVILAIPIGLVGGIGAWWHNK